MKVTVGDKDGNYKGRADMRLIGPNQFEFVGPLDFTVDPGDIVLLSVISDDSPAANSSPPTKPSTQ